jgi:hypothetical protein
MAFYQGDEAYLYVTFTNRTTGALADPTTVALAVQDPQGGTVHKTWAGGSVFRTGVGQFYALQNLTLGGFWLWRWVGDGAIKAAVQGRILVEPASVL